MLTAKIRHLKSSYGHHYYRQGGVTYSRLIVEELLSPTWQLGKVSFSVSRSRITSPRCLAASVNKTRYHGASPLLLDNATNSQPRNKPAVDSGFKKKKNNYNAVF